MRLFWGFANIAFQAGAMYRLEFWMRIFGNLVAMYGAYWLWTTLYIQQPGAFPVSLGQMVTYGMLAMIMDTVIAATEEVNWYIQGQMRSGALQMDLLRPLDFQFHLLARNAGRLLVNLLTLGLPGFVIGVLFLGLRAPVSLAHGLLFLLSLLPAYLVAFSLVFLLGMVSVYTTASDHITWFYYSTLAFLSGQFVPLWIFPDSLQRVIGLLPFQSIIGIPLSIYIGRFSLAEIGYSLALQTFWAVVLLVLSHLVWQNAYTKLTVQGG